MKPAQIKRTIEALGSGRFKQGEGALICRDSGEVQYCCLGVACRVNGISAAQLFKEDKGMPSELEEAKAPELPKQFEIAASELNDGVWLPEFEYWTQEEIDASDEVLGKDRAVPHALIALMFMGWNGKE